MCGGEISLDKRVRDILLEYMIDFPIPQENNLKQVSTMIRLMIQYNS